MTSWQQHLDTKSDEEITEISSHEVSHSILTIGLVGKYIHTYVQYIHSYMCLVY